MTKPRLSLFHELKERGVRHSRRQVDRLEAKGLFPKRVAMGERLVGWVTDEIDAHVDQEIASRSTEVGKLGSFDVRHRLAETPETETPETKEAAAAWRRERGTAA